MTRDEIYEHIEFSAGDPEVHAVGPMYSESGYDYEQALKIFKFAYNLALDHSAENVEIKTYRGETEVDKESILNLKITE